MVKKRVATMLLAAVIGVTAVSPAAAAVTYLELVRLAPGYGGISGYNARTYNWIGFDNPYGGMPQMGANYFRSDSTDVGWVWSNTGNLYDDRDNAYARAACTANWGNGYDVDLWWCETN